MRNRLKTFVLAGFVAIVGLTMPLPAAHADTSSPFCPYENPNACCGWVFIGSKGIKLFDCW